MEKLRQETHLVSLIQKLSKATAVVPPQCLPLQFEPYRSSRIIKHSQGGSKVNIQLNGPLSDIRVILFDIYGTLFSSAAGDIGTEGPPLFKCPEPDSVLTCYEQEAAYFRKAVLERHLTAYAVTPYPEVRVEEIWEAYQDKPENLSGAEYALRYELEHNPVTPMPGALNCIRTLLEKGFELGIVSNAQFYTPLLFKAFWGADPIELGFTEAFIAYSYIHGRAKPDPELFKIVLDEVRSKGYQVDECLYVGNDMLNDVFGAKNVGMRAALFAGDKKSLRLREDNPLCKDLLPDLVIDSLTDLPHCVAKGPNYG
ncbi:HAD family hydrolase [Gracilinema caldarium]|nr:HAD family hydrolase [Gracilinema caldarium]